LAADVTIRPLSPTTVVGEAPTTALQAARVRKAADPAQKFESFVLQSFIQEMMPDEAEGVYGSGVSGDFWKSMMAEKIAEQVAERGSLGIAHYIKAGQAPRVPPHGIVSTDVMSHLATLGAGAAAATDTDPNSGIGE
jgi:Rod binding domain-containing protein